MTKYDALELFAGSGCGVALERLGYRSLGVETMAEAVATRQALGWDTLLNEDGTGVSVADLPSTFAVGIPILAGGPPCQTFSMAGKGAGRAALELVLKGVDVVARGEKFRPPEDTDPRTWLVLEPLRIALHSRPTYIFLEQVPAVLPVWEAYARVLEHAHGYSVWTGILRSEQYGVPQTRRRAILIARLDGKPAAPPVPTHSRYYERDPHRLDPGVKPWVSMAEALGWGTTGRPGFTVIGGGSGTGGAEPFGRAARESLLDVAYRTTTMPNATVRDESLPAPTIAFGNDAKSAGWIQRSNYTSRSVKSTPSPVPGSPPLGRRDLDEPSHTLTSKAHKWVEIRPSTTVLGDPRISQPGHRDRSGGESQFLSDAQAIRVTVQEAAVLQSFPADHPFQGTRGKQYLQAGNACPPLLFEAMLRTIDDS